MPAIERRTVLRFAYLPVPIDGRWYWNVEYRSHEEAEHSETAYGVPFSTVSRSLVDPASESIGAWCTRMWRRMQG